MGKNITQLQDKNGSIVTGVQNILEVEREFYQNLSSSKVDQSKVDKNLWETFFPACHAPRGIKFEALEEPLTEAEIHAAILGCENNKAPGTDGIPVDFYKAFWEQIKPYLVRSFLYSLKTSNLSLTQHSGVLI